MASEKVTDAGVSLYLSKAMKTIGRAKGLTMQLLTFAKGGAPIREIGQLFPFIQEAARFVLSGSNISCEFSIPEDLWLCDFDRNQIGQVIDNMVINAKQAMPNGGELVISAANVTMLDGQHPGMPAGKYVEISIKDSGVGIPDEILPRIFDPFYSTKASGHGLGLATSYSIISRHGGTIGVESKSGKGSTFRIYLPAADSRSGRSSVDAPIGAHAGHGIFLVMDDQEVVRESIVDMLNSFGYTAFGVDDGKTAVEFVKTELKARGPIAGMIFDLTVPGGLGGKDVIAEIRALCPQTPVFVASGYAKDPVMATPEEYGFTASISKPFTRLELFRLLGKHSHKT
jgi:CheY-like chemotaxis protein